ncbi:unnamed protein product, partial [Mesorhabditis belari]|uniref:SH3 domain-containing protein n=1 Tax=Mesorhabditis belari TaxID=2138241 RepID=A0AAF3F6R5_9BILA
MEVIGESDSLANLHAMARDRLNDEIVKTLSLFRKENHHPSAFRAPKEIREVEDAFEKAQRQWRKLYERTEVAKKAYYTACRSERSAAVLLANAQQDTSISLDGTQKMRDRCEKAHEEVLRTKQNYEKFLGEINTYKSPYMENMSLKFFVEMITGTEHVLVDLINNNKFQQLHEQIQQRLRTTDERALNEDLTTWCLVYGIDAPTCWPNFEEYHPEMREISARKCSAKDASGGVVLTRQVIKADDEILPTVAPHQFQKPQEKRGLEIHRPQPGSSHGSENGKQGSSSDSDTNTFDSQKSNQKNRNNNNNNNKNIINVNGYNGNEARRWESLPQKPVTSMIHPPLHSTNSMNSSSAASNPPSSRTPDSEKFSEFDDYQKQLATVLYDYSPIENDEIGLKKGETIEVLSEPDSLGWCTGRKGGLTGLFPASYVQVM